MTAQSTEWGPGRRHRPPPDAARQRGAAAAALAVVLLVTGGCSVAGHESPASVTGTIADALGEARSAAGTAGLAVRLLADGDVTAPVGDGALLDQLEVLDEAERILTVLVPPDPGTSELRAAGLDAVGEVSTAVVAAREWVAARDDADLRAAVGGPERAAELEDALEESSATVDDLLTRAGAS